MHICSRLLYCKTETCKHQHIIQHEVQVIQHLMQTYVKDLKPGDIQDSDKELARLFGVQHLINADDHPQKHLLIDGLRQRTDGVVDLHNDMQQCDHTVYEAYVHSSDGCPGVSVQLRSGLK